MEENSKSKVTFNIYGGNNPILPNATEAVPLPDGGEKALQSSNEFTISEDASEFTQSAKEAYESVLKYAGASLKYDDVDKRIIANVRNGDYTADGSNGSEKAVSYTHLLKEVHDRAFTDATKRDAAWTALMGKDFFDAIVDENAWELAGEGVRKFDLIRWNLLSEKIDEFKNEYTNAVYNGTYPQYVNRCV